VWVVIVTVGISIIMSGLRRSVVRQRQEFLDRKQKEGVHESIHARKEQLRTAIDNATPLPGHLRKDAVTLKKFVELDDDVTRKFRTTVDDEYALAGVQDPKILVTTSREPSQKLMEFTKEIRLMLPNSTRMNRGGIAVSQVVEAARRDNFSDVVVISESKGVPDSITISHLPLGPTVVFTLHNIVTRHDIEGAGPMSEQAPHLIFENFTTRLGQRIRDALKFLFPVPRVDSTRVLTFDNSNDYISFRHHTFNKKGEKVTLTEVGPRFELQPYRVMLGTIDMTDAETEWVMHPFLNSSKRRRVL
jgi:U3 small nucleolar ribonucleoprotein protein IMP4